MPLLRDRLYDKGLSLGLLTQPAFEIHPKANQFIPDEEQQKTPVHQAFFGNDGSLVHKWRHYLSHYHRHLDRFRGSKVHLLEIGVSQGGSLRMWRKYFGEDAVIFGVDVDEHCRQFDGESAQVRIGSQRDPTFLKSVAKEMGAIDIVIDDGSHIASHQNTSFDVLFPIISPTGVYICEDTHTAYWPGHYEGGLKRSSTFIERAKKIVDDLHADFHKHPQSIDDANRQISGVHFYNSMVVIEKEPQLPSMSLQVGG